MSELVRHDVTDGVATVTLDSPHNRNALSRALVAQLASALDAAEADPAVTVLVLTATGTTFCAGADMSEAASGAMEEGSRRLIAVFRKLLASSKPVIARVGGHVRAGGIGLVGACDIAVVTQDATFAFTEVRLGLTPAMISLTTLPRMPDRAAALRYLGGASFDGTEAARIGLVTTAVPTERLDEELAAVTAALLKGHPQGLRETKRLLNAALVRDIDERGAELAALSARLFSSDEARQAMREFLTRRSSR
ncbi:MAG TPA: enoyl-CoA hydratase family protein [Nocardioidaceae bacterium]|jgi:enoyl-CoA hydratase/methylglutaconyl-CoA hydratase|nr:enoyl-CoA hydratase family protein [Actinomycetota bacterium]MDQ3422563.1 enoyl-CoA hydratase family protein [Actinomycetota bacterium]HEV8055935.1 enoyl-CoA hydratase family protein [Nocardioidaceae bacterium]